MRLVIQRAELRRAGHAKLDELLKVNGDAKDELMSIDDGKDAKEVERKRTKVQAARSLSLAPLISDSA